jgi:membrane-associated phospholipid phosphatase
MKTILCIFFLLFGAFVGFAQNTEPSSGPAADQPNAPDQQPVPAEQSHTTPNQNDAQRSAPLGVQPGGAVIKNKDFYERTGYWHPFVRMPKYLLIDQKNIWTSPFNTRKQDIKYWLIFGSITGGLIAADKYIENAAPNNPTLRRVGIDASYLGQAYSLLPIAAGFYFIGTAKGEDHFRETGLLAFEAVADTAMMQLALKPLFSRARPFQGDGHGHFWDSPSRISAGFPSGHSINTFAVASIIEHQYHHHLWAKVLCFGYGAGVAAARLAARQHFPSDVFAGAVMGWFTGDYVYTKRHNPDLDTKPSVTDRILDHVHFGAAGE